MGGAQFPRARQGTPHDGTHLTAGIDTVQDGARRGIPKFEGPIGRATPTGQQAAMKGTPIQGLDGRLVLSQNQARCMILVLLQS